jgi:hypothetical protein
MTQIEFRGYSGDCVIHGDLAVPDDSRLTDFLNSIDTYAVANMSLYALDDGRRVPAGEQQLSTDDLWAVEPTDSSARADLHVPTRQVAVVIDVSPYQVTGFFHGVNTGDPMAVVNRRRRMIPVTEAEIRFNYSGREIRREAPVLIINRDHAKSIRRVAYQRTKIDDVPLAPTDPYARDLTGEITFDRDRP